MSLSRYSKVGVGLLLAGLLPVLILSLWRATLNTIPVLTPISLSGGHIAKSFTINFTGTYTVRIEVERKLPFDTLQCLLGVGAQEALPEGQCKNIPTALNASWTVTENGQIIKAGASATADGGVYANDSIANELGWFEGKRGHHYVLDMNILQDGSALAVTNPKLRVGIDEAVYEDSVFADLLVFGWAVLTCVIGASLLVFSVVRGRMKRSLTNRQLT